MIRCRTQGSTTMAVRVGTDEATSHDMNVMLETRAARHLGTERIGGHRREPQRGRQAETHHARKHQVAGESPPARLVGRGAAGFRETDDEWIQHAPRARCCSETPVR
jgi:hypothetical protein